jgi:hypothetical protein
MRVSFLHRASGLFIASWYRRENYKRELKMGKWRASNAVKARTVSRESLRLGSGQACSDTFAKI